MFEGVKIISGGDAKYFDLLKDLAQSIRDQADGNSIDIAFLDGGLLEEQIHFFESLNISVVNPGWLHPEALKRNAGKDFLKVEIAKVHLDLLFPDAEILIWIDADAWLQNLKALELFSLVAHKNKFAIVSQASRLQRSHLNFKPAFFNRVELRNILYKNARRANLSSSIVKNMMARPTLNAGVYALKSGAPQGYLQLLNWHLELLYTRKTCHMKHYRIFVISWGHIVGIKLGKCLLIITLPMNL